MNEIVSQGFFERILRSRFLLLILIVVFIFSIIQLKNEIHRRLQINEQIKQIRAEIDNLQGENKQLTNMIEYFKSDSYIEREARTRLNLRQPGESIVIIDSADNSAIAANNQNLSNAERWWKYFFDD